MSDRKNRTKEEWLSLIQQCRRNGMTDAQWCLANGISRHTFNNAIKRLRKCSYAIPSRSPRDIYDLTSSEQDVVKVDIVPDFPLPREAFPEVASHIDNSNTLCSRLPINVRKSISNAKKSMKKAVAAIRKVYPKVEDHPFPGIGHGEILSFPKEMVREIKKFVEDENA